MSKSQNLQTTQECLDITLHRRMLRRSVALAIGLGLTASSVESNVYAQFNSGDLPASPWSNRSDNVQPSNSGNRNTSERLRQPGMSIQPPTSANPNETSHVRPGVGQVRDLPRPAPITLLGPMVPHPSQTKSADKPEPSIPSTNIRPLDFPGAAKNPASPRNESSSLNQKTALPSHALTQKKPIDAQSDWHRVQASGLVLETESKPDSGILDFDTDSQTEQLASRSDRIMGTGLPDRDNIAATTKLPSQMASSKSSDSRDEPITLQSTNRSTATHRTETPLQLEHPGRKASLVHSVEEPTPDVPDVISKERAKPGLEVLPTSKARVDDVEMKRIALAQRVSHERLSDPAAAPARAPEVLESLPGWQSIERELKQRLEQCDSLLRRGAILSAREEANQGLLRLYRTMDLHRGSLFSEPAFEKALTAMREEADFLKNQGSSGIQAIVDSHTTDALKNRPLESTSPEMAAMHYRWYARYQLVTASDSHPWAADLLYAYGKTLEKDAELNPDRATMFRNQAVVCYQAATQTKPTQSEAANQLGFALIHLGRIDEAYNALSASIQCQPNANAWNNLAEVFRQRGAVADVEYALQQAAALEAGKPKYSYDNPEITEVEPAVFAKYSPMPTMASPSQNFSQNNVSASDPNGNRSTIRNAKSGSLFSKIFK